MSRAVPARKPESGVLASARGSFQLPAGGLGAARNRVASEHETDRAGRCDIVGPSLRRHPGYGPFLTHGHEMNDRLPLS